jgi:hypothetical protein
MDNKTRLQHFINGTGINPQSDEDITFGETNALFSPSGVEEVMKHHVSFIDNLLSNVKHNITQQLELFSIRGFTFNEFQALFDLNIREKDFNLHPAIRSLWITNENERRKIVYNLDKQNFNDFFKILAQCLQRYNPHLLTFFFRTIPSCKIPIQKFTSPHSNYW